MLTRFNIPFGIPRGAGNPPIRLRKKRAFRIELMKLAAFYLALYIVLSPAVAMPVYSWMLFPSDKRVYDTAGPMKQISQVLKVKTDELFFNAQDGAKLHGYFFHMPGAKKVMLVSHGNGGNIERGFVLYAALLLCHASVFAYDYLTQQCKVPAEQIVVYGASLGTAVSCQIAAQRKVCGIVLQSGFPSLASTAHHNLFFLRAYPDRWFDFDQMDNIAVLQKKHAPLLVIHGEDDPILSYAGGLELFQAASPPKQMLTLKKFGHVVTSFDRQEFNSAITSFLSSLP
ncbi:MAG: alpha/beta hydrolase [Terriglobales bacterium]